VTYDDWKLLKFGANASNPSIAGPLANPDGDPLANALEYALLTEPLGPDAGAFAPAVPTTLPGPVEARQFTFPYRPESRDLIYTLQLSDNLTNWTNAYQLNLATGAVSQLAGASGATDPGTRTVTVTITDLGLFTPRSFWRLAAQTP
jgi:hypothetical protein